MMEKPVAIVLGGTSPHVELIRQLKERGYYTILVDYLAQSPAKQYADLHIQESTLDHDKVYEIATEIHADLIIATCIDHANSTACDVLERMGKHYPYSAKIAKDVTDKSLMKQIMKKNNLPTSDFVIVNSPDAKISLDYPVVVKPVDSNGNRGIRKIENEKDLRIAISEAILSSRTKTAIVEEFAEGVEVSIYTYILHGEAHVILSNERKVMLDPITGKMPGYAMVYPSKEVIRLEKRIQKVCTDIARAFHLENTPLVVQAKINGDDLSIIELMPRIGGGQSYWNIKRLTGFDMMSAAIDSYIGIEPALDYHSPDMITITNNVYTRSAIFGRIEGGETIVEKKYADEFKQLRFKGDAIEENLSTGNRVCTFIVSGTTWEEVLQKVEKAFVSLKVYDIEGNSIKREDIYLSK